MRSVSMLLGPATRRKHLQGPAALPRLSNSVRNPSDRHRNRRCCLVLVVEPHLLAGLSNTAVVAVAGNGDAGHGVDEALGVAVAHKVLSRGWEGCVGRGQGGDHVGWACEEEEDGRGNRRRHAHAG